MEQGPPPRPGANKLPEPSITRPRPRLKSHDDASAVRAVEEANLREGQLLAKLATEQQLRMAEEQRREEAEARARRLEAIERARLETGRHKIPIVVQQSPPSVAPAGEAFRAKEVRIGDLKGWAAMLSGLTALIVGVIGYIKPAPPPKVIDNAATVSALQAELSRLSKEVNTLRLAQQAGENWTGSAFEAIGVDVTRAEGAAALPALNKTPLTLKPIKTVVRIDTPQPTTPPPTSP